MDPKIEKFLLTLTPEKRALAMQVRDIFLAADKRVEECIKWRQLTFTYKGDLAFIYSFSKDYMNLGFMQAVKLSDPKKLFEGTGKGMRHIKIYKPKDISSRQIKAWVKEAMKVNEVIAEAKKK